MKRYKYFLFFLINFLIFGITIGYSSFNNLLYVDGMSLSVRREESIRITDISVIDSDGGSSIYDEYDNDTVVMGINLNNKNSFITYKIEVTNYGNIPMGIYSIEGINEGLNMEVINYNVGDKICDSNNNCTNGISQNFYIKISPNLDITDKGFDIRLLFNFREFHSITYEGVDLNNNFPKEIIDGGSLNIDFSAYSVCDLIVHVGEHNLLDYNFNNRLLLIDSVQSDLHIELITFDAEISEVQFSINNLDYGAEFIMTTEGALSEIYDIINRMMEINFQILNSSNGEVDVSSLNLELEQLVLEIDNICDNTRFNELQVFSGFDFDIEFRGDIIGIHAEKINSSTLDIEYSYVENSDMANENFNKLIYAAGIISNYRSYLGSKLNQIGYLSNYFSLCLEEFQSLNNVYDTSLNMSLIGLNSILEVLGRINDLELGIQYNPDDILVLGGEINTILSAIDYIANHTIVKDNNTLNGSFAPIEKMSVDNLGKNGRLIINFDDSSMVQSSIDDCLFAIEKVNSMKNLVYNMKNGM